MPSTGLTELLGLAYAKPIVIEFAVSADPWVQSHRFLVVIQLVTLKPARP